MSNIVLVIDWQNNYFKGDNSQSKYMKGAVEKTRRIVEAARKNDDQVVWIALSYKNTNPWSECEHSIVPELHLKEDGDKTFIKSTCDTFECDAFNEWISAQNFDRLIFTGYHINDCVKKTLISAIRKGWGDKCILVRDACGPAPSKKYSMGDDFNFMANFSNVVICSADRAIQSLLRPTKSITQWSSRTPIKKLSKNMEWKGCLTLKLVVESDTLGMTYPVLNEYIRAKNRPKNSFWKRIPYHTETTLRLWAKSHNVSDAHVNDFIKNPYNEDTHTQIDDAVRLNGVKPHRNAVHAIA